MPMTNFPQGFAAGLSVRGLPLLQTQPGNVFWVDNSPILSPDPVRTIAGSDNNRGTFERPFATIYGALQHCQHGNGDIIFVKPGHQEIVNGAGTTTAVTAGLGTTLRFDVGGVAIIGLGSGGMRPTFQFNTAATANIPVRASNISIQNFSFVANFADVASVFTAVSCSAATCTISGTTLTTGAITGTMYPGMNLTGTGVLPGTIVIKQLTGTAGAIGTYQVNKTQTVTSTTILGCTHDFNIEQCDFTDKTSVLNFLTIYTGGPTNANNGDGLRFVRNRIYSLGTTAATTAIVASIATSRVQINDNFICRNGVVNNTASVLDHGSVAMTNLEMARNVVFSQNTDTATGGILITTSNTSNTGMVSDNYIKALDAAAAILVTAGSIYGMTNNLYNGDADASGFVLPAIGTN